MGEPARAGGGCAGAGTGCRCAGASAGPAADSEVQPATGTFERLGVTGAVRAGYWSSTRNLDPESHLGAGMLWLKASRRVSERVTFLAEGWTSLRGPFDNGDAAGELREAFIELRFERLDVRAGRQISLPSARRRESAIRIRSGPSAAGR